MTSLKSIVCRACFVLCVMVMMASTGGSASGQETTTNAPTPKSATCEIQDKKIDQVGEKINQSIDRIQKNLSPYLGEWTSRKVFAGITWFKLLFCVVLAVMVLLVERLLRWFIRLKVSHLQDQADVLPVGIFFLKALSRPLTFILWSYGIYAALFPLYAHFSFEDGSNPVQLILKTVAQFITAIAVIWCFVRLAELVDAQLKKWAVKTGSGLDDLMVPLMGKTLRVVIVIIGGIIIIQNMTGIKIGPLLASLGIGGIAIALAAKDSIANFFGTLTIIFDKPFKPGERIVINGNDGVIETVGFRSTRIRTLAGHLLTIPNEQVVNSSIENIGKRPNIRWLNNIGVTYDTPPEKVEKAVQMIRDILANHEGMRKDMPPRVYFNGFNDWSLNILVVAWYHPPDYWAFQTWVQKTCLEIMRAFEAEGIDFAFPSQTVYVANDDKRQLKLETLKEPL